MPPTLAPLTAAKPALGCNRPETTLSKVDLPQPDGPTMVTMEPSGTSSDTPRTASTAPRSRGRNIMPIFDRRIFAGVGICSGTVDRRLPAQQPRLDLAHDGAEQPGDDRERHQAGEHRSGVEIRRATRDHVANTLIGGENLGDDDAEQRIGQADIEPGENPRQRRGQRDFP